MSLSKNQLKLITSLKQKKQRQKKQLFVAEGIKLVGELLNSCFELEHLFVLENSHFETTTDKISYITATELKKISNLTTPNTVLALFKIPSEKDLIMEGLVIALDGVNDPGNLGTIIRLCDWFGVNQLLCSKNTVDCYNQKVIQSTMGSLSRVQINYVDLEKELKNTSLKIYTADIKGDNIYQVNLVNEAILVLGNEANGISPEIDNLIKQKITIPRFGKNNKTESLNVATATAILLSEFVGHR